jgi:NAD+ diphosphatase
MSPHGDFATLGYTGSLLVRAAPLRLDAAALAALACARTAGFYVISGELIVLKKGADGEHDPLFGREEAQRLAEPDESVFLGLLEGEGRFAVAIAAQAAARLKSRAGLRLKDLRSIAVQGLVAPAHLPPLAEAKALLAWHARHRFCSACGAPSRLAEGGWRRDCPSCSAEHFPRTDPVVIMLASSGERCVLGRQARFAPGMWSCLAGFVEPGESIEEAVRRETHEEAGVVCGRVSYLASQPWPFPMSLMIACHAEALSEEIAIDRSELEDARWFEREEVALMLHGRHPHGLTTPPPVAIAHHLIRAWLEGKTCFA